MIANERQYRISKNAADRFREALSSLDKEPHPIPGVHPKFMQAQRTALQSQLDELLADIAAYENLKAGAISSISIGSMADFADGLISARIASGLSQKGLAERLGLKEQQIQRYEAERYSSASYQRLQEVAKAIGVEVRKEILLPSNATNLAGILHKLRQVGVSQEFAFGQLLSAKDIAASQMAEPNADNGRLMAKLSDTVTRVFGWTQEELFAPEPLSSPRFAGASARFKMPARRAQGTVSAYTTYAHYLASVCLLAAKSIPIRTVPIDAEVMRKNILDAYGYCDLRSTLRFLWDCGVPVLPLRGAGAFHGASWRHEGRNVIVLKQKSAHEQRWLYDLLHESYHAGSDPERLTHETIEADETSRERRESPEEIEAAQFAGNVVLFGKSEEIARACVSAARGSVERLKGVVPGLAQQYHVEVGALANYLAFRLSWQGINWWGAAANLQRDSEDPWLIARDIFLERFPFGEIDKADRELLERALQ